MTWLSSPSDPARTTLPTTPIQCVPSASGSASNSASTTPPGHARVQCVRPSPTPTGTDALNEPSATTHPSASNHTDALVHFGADHARPTSLHGNGANSFEHTTLDVTDVTCRLCLSLLERSAEVGA